MPNIEKQILSPGPIKVLIAEDNSVSARILQKSIEDWGYKVFLARDGLQAWKVLQDEEIGLAVLDWMMPKINGIELCKRIRQNNHRNENYGYTYVILLSARDEQRDLIRGFSAGADDYITKPFHQLELKARLKTGKRLIDLQRQLQEQANRDGLTGLWNRKRMYRILEKEINRAQRLCHSLAIIMIDIDHFKGINDTYGHQSGDAILQEVPSILKRNIRNYDEICRYGGDEFLLILPNCCPDETKSIAERLRLVVSDKKINTNNTALNITISLGGVSTGDKYQGFTPQSMISASDEALLQAKNKGRNRVVVKKLEERM
jgi:two-component system cell cycle response regulator